MSLVAVVRQRPRPLGNRGTLMARCQVVGLPVASSCSGRGSCGKCLVKVIRGQEALSPPDAHETRVLTRQGAGPDERLACQTHIQDPLAQVMITTGYW